MDNRAPGGISDLIVVGKSGGDDGVAEVPACDAHHHWANSTVDRRQRARQLHDLAEQPPQVHDRGRALLTFRAPRSRVVVDGEEREFQAMRVAVANHGSIGGGMKIAPGAKMDDGLLPLFVVDRMSKPRFLQVFPEGF